VLFYTVKHFAIDTDLNNMISDKVPYRMLEIEFEKAFPQLMHAIVIVIDAETPEATRYHKKRLAERLGKEKDLFEQIYMPGDGEFFEKNGLLYLNVDELEELADNLAQFQPFLAFISRDFSLRALFTVFEKVLNQKGDIEHREGIIPLLDALSEAFEKVVSGQPYHLSWQGLMIGQDAAEEMRRQFIILKPVPDPSELSTGEAAIEAVRSIRDELGLNGASGVRVRLTGEAVLAYENLLAVRSGIGIASLISLIFVGLALMVGLGSAKHVLASLLTLMVGLIWTLWFAIAFIGHLNLISVAFVVLFIGLGVDSSMQFCLRYRELTALGFEHHEAIIRTGRGVGVGLLLCAITTAIGFYAFLPTAYAGVSELGLISGTGMFINLIATFTVLPAVLTLMPLRKGNIKGVAADKFFYLFPYEHERAIRLCAIVAAMVAALFVPKVFFDFNPLNLYDPHSESVSTMKELLRSSKTSPWTISALVENAGEAEELAGRLRSLDEVAQVITLSDFVPDKQSEKIDIISNIGLLMPPGLGHSKPEKLSHEERVRSLKIFEKVIKDSLFQSSEERDDYWISVRRLFEAIESFKAVFENPEHGERAFDRLENGLLGNLPVLLNDLEASLQAYEFTESDLPGELRGQYVTLDGRYRVQVFPGENIIDHDALERFVRAVTAKAPNAVDAPVSIREAGKAVARSFVQATAYALIAITIYLFIEFKSLAATMHTLLPLMFSLLLTGAASVILDIPFNFANVIVVPLLLGIGVDSGIHFMHRFRAESFSDSNILKTSTARAVFFSALTTIFSFSSLSFSPHQGMASMGKLLTLCIGFLIITTFFLLPGLLRACRSCRL
jgi:hopanoid biosynthesis associated RND transporter like protein HpnN